MDYIKILIIVNCVNINLVIPFDIENSVRRTSYQAKCPNGYFPCHSSLHCIHQRFQCDKKPNCLDESDELNCLDQNLKEYYNNLFRKRWDEDREVKQKTNCEMKNVPKECTCSSMSVFCEHQNLFTVPSPLPNEIYDLDLSGNQLSEINQESFPLELKYLEVLIMTSSGIENIKKDSFKKLTNLKHLYMSGNKLTIIRNESFGNKALNLLVLSHNPLITLEPNAFYDLTNLTELDLRYCKLQSLPQQIFDPLENLETLWLDVNQLTELPTDIFSNLINLDTLSLTKNKLTYITTDILWGLDSLRVLSLASNRINYIGDSSFGNLTSLLKLDLRDNQIHSFGRNTFKYMKNLESLELQKNQFLKLSDGIFDDLTSLTHIYFDDFKLCSFTMHVRVCEPRGDGISSFQHLLDNVVLRISVWIVALVACVGNLFVLIGRMMMHEPNEVHSFFIKNLALADLLMGIYLFIIAYHDTVFRGEYIRHEEKWRRSWQCNISGLLSTISSESSVFILTVITIDRYVSVVHPFNLKRRTKTFAYICMGSVWAIASLLAFLPLLDSNIFGDEFYGSNGVCLALHISDPYGKGWEYSAFLFCIVNSAAFLFITYAYISMSITITSSGIGLRTTQQQQDRNIAKRCSFIVGTDCLCWMPIVVIKILVLSGVEINDNLYAWVAVFLLPVNSALNPVLYTLTTKLFKQHFAKIIAYSFHSNRNGSPGADHSGTSFSSVNLPSRGSYNKRSVITTFADFDRTSNSHSDSFLSRQNNGSLMIPNSAKSKKVKMTEQDSFL